MSDVSIYMILILKNLLTTLSMLKCSRDIFYE